MWLVERIQSQIWAKSIYKTVNISKQVLNFSWSIGNFELMNQHELSLPEKITDIPQFFQM